jgi:hypothetical protein
MDEPLVEPGKLKLTSDREGITLDVLVLGTATAADIILVGTEDAEEGPESSDSTSFKRFLHFSRVDILVYWY